jgi:hypothetical protein
LCGVRARRKTEGVVRSCPIKDLTPVSGGYVR